MARFGFAWMAEGLENMGTLLLWPTITTVPLRSRARIALSVASI